MFSARMLMRMICTDSIRIIIEIPFQVCCHIDISQSACPREEFNSGLCQSSACTPADTAADQCLYAEVFQKSCKSTMTASVCGDHF